jgi:hypothetical protein
MTIFCFHYTLILLKVLTYVACIDLRFVVVHDQFTRPPATAATSLSFSATPFTFSPPFATSSSPSSSSSSPTSSPSSSSSSPLSLTSNMPVVKREGVKDEDDRRHHQLDIKPNLSLMGNDKTVEDLKARFYSIQQQLLKTRNASDPGIVVLSILCMHDTVPSDCFGDRC